MSSATDSLGPTILGKRVRYARELKNLTQAELSAKLGFNDRQTLTAIEAGTRSLSVDELLQVMGVLDVDLEFFTDTYRLVGEGQFSWRASTNAAPEKLSQFEERAGRWLATYRRLGELKGEVPKPLEYRLSLTVENSFEDAEAAGEAVTKLWELGDCPAKSLESAISRYLGALVLWVDAPGAISGAAFKMPGLSAILINRNEAAGRRHFDLAHECFHLLTWEQMTPEYTEVASYSLTGNGRQKRIEQLANAFAGALLMPHALIAERWATRRNRAVHAWIDATAGEFQVTSRALMWRCKQIGLISKTEVAAVEPKLARESNASSRNRPKEFSREFATRLQKGIDAGAISVRKAASIVGRTVQDLADMFKSYQLAVPFEP